ncbi:MAG: transcription antitermination factor NusB [Oscillospiraceae bacterium]
MKRSEIREAAFLLTFEKLFTDDSVDSIIDTAYEVDEFEMDEECEELFKAVNEKAAEIDDIIAKNSEKRQLSRIPKVSIAILRIAIYEMLYSEKVPNNVAISEAVLLAKKFTYTPDVKFINGVLGVIAKELENKAGAEE